MKKIFAANWKLNKTPDESREFVIDLKNSVFSEADFFSNCELILLPSAFSLEAVSSLCSGTAIHFGPQNIFAESGGAYTGENSAQVAKSLNSGFALTGHSERRTLFFETDELINKKNLLLQSLGLIPIFCIGETLSEREAGRTVEVCLSQLAKGLRDLNTQQRVVVAYEPVWAIGTGRVASVEQVAEVHATLQHWLKEKNFLNCQLLYGGSVRPENAAELLQIPHVHGFLIGGAALQVESFLKICRS